MNKLAKFAEMAEMPNVLQVPAVRLEPGDEVAYPGTWHARFGNDRPIVLELGCGRGEYAVGLARRFPEKNFIGVDIKGARMWHGAREALNEGLHNVLFLRTHIEFIQRFFAPGEVSEIWLTFSDPQMKHVRKRLTSSYFLERYRQFLTPDGLIHVKTDSPFLFAYTTALLETSHIAPHFAESNIYDAATAAPTLPPYLHEIQTYYEQQWLGRGKTIKYLCFPLPAAPAPLTEPEEEFELDDYRSYNRTKRSGLERAK